ncbi:MAG: guanylate kinase [Hyphomicrobiales bacterium]|nr:guanylate kinase [Ahrensia sp. AH-315-G08]PCH48148.1 MAG: guanylate kinase [Hyphomicrobiales bacterium]
MLVLSSPSGAGKSTIARNLLGVEKNLSLSVSVTTRQRRPSEIDGTHYHFISQKQFEFSRDNNELLEWAEVHGNFYGTPLPPVQEAMQLGRDMLFDVDWQGALQMFDTARADIVSIFILPPSMTELRSRLVRRAEDSSDVIERRLANAKTEIRHWDDYDYVIINNDLDKAFGEVQSILRAERLRRDRCLGLHEFVDGLLE